LTIAAGKMVPRRNGCFYRFELGDLRACAACSGKFSKGARFEERLNVPGFYSSALKIPPAEIEEKFKKV
jgi:hypothetical protein